VGKVESYELGPFQGPGGQTLVPSNGALDVRRAVLVFVEVVPELADHVIVGSRRWVPGIREPMSLTDTTSGYKRAR
jgi:hypothetical protein